MHPRRCLYCNPSHIHILSLFLHDALSISQNRYTYRDFANADQTTLDHGNCHGGGRVPAASLQSQKLPSKLAAMLSDPGEYYRELACWGISLPYRIIAFNVFTYGLLRHIYMMNDIIDGTVLLPSHILSLLLISYIPPKLDLTSVITWMPHGRSWKILNREMFSTFALPRYFGHSNHASFVRIVNAW